MNHGSIFFAFLLASISLSARTNKHQAIKKVESQNSKQRLITIKNGIQPSMLSYWSYHPDTFTLLINGKSLEKNQSKQFPIENNRLNVSYHCTFARGAYKSTRELIYEIPAHAQESCVTFSWQEKERLLVSHGKLFKKIK